MPLIWILLSLARSLFNCLCVLLNKLDLLVDLVKCFFSSLGSRLGLFEVCNEPIWLIFQEITIVALFLQLRFNDAHLVDKILIRDSQLRVLLYERLLPANKQGYLLREGAVAAYSTDVMGDSGIVHVHRRVLQLSWRMLLNRNLAEI